MANDKGRIDKATGVSIKQIAKLAGVSVATVSRALNPDSEHLVKSQTLEKIKGIIKNSGYFPHRAARALREGKTRTLGILMNFKGDTILGYVGEIMRGVLKGLEEIGYDLKLISKEEFYSLEAIFNNAGVDGIILTHAYQDTFPYLAQEIAKRKERLWPVVLINDHNLSWKVNQLYVDSYKASRVMIENLIQKGFQDFYLMAGEENSNDARARKKAFLDVIGDRGINFSGERIINGHFSEEGGYLAMKNILERPAQFRGLAYCLNDAMAMAALRAIGEYGLNCPRDIKLIGFDGIPQGEFTNPPLTTMKFPLSEMGYQAVEIIYRIIQGKAKRYIRKEFPFELKLRASS